MTADDRLKAALSLGADEPPATDQVFAARAIGRVERRRFQIRLLMLALWAVAGGIVIWALRPAVGDAMTPAIPLLAPATALTVVVGLVLRADFSKTVRRVRRMRLPGLF